MNHAPTPRDPLNEAEQREWLAQERAWRDERAGTALAACLGLSWATEALRRRLPAR